MYGMVQMFSSDAVSTGEGVYWMYYTGGSFEEAEVPSGMPGLPEGTSVEGIRYKVSLSPTPEITYHTVAMTS